MKSPVVAAPRTITLPFPHAEQQPQLIDPSRFKVSVQGRRWGKSMMGLVAVIEGHGDMVYGDPMFGDRPRWRGAAFGGNIWWVAPTFTKDTVDVWELLKFSLGGAWKQKHEGQRRIVLPGGGSVTIRSADDPESLRSQGLDGVVVDEAAYLDERAWPRLRPALADREGWAWFISTPHGYNWFREIYEDALRLDNWNRWHGPTTSLTVAAGELAALKAEMHPTKYRQEILAEFVDIGGEVFKREWFRYAELSDQGEAPSVMLHDGNGQKIFPLDRCWKLTTCDLATSSKTTADYTVISTWIVTPDRDIVLCDMVRGQIEGPQQLDAIEQAFHKHRPRAVFVESVAYQLTAVQHLKQRKVPVMEHRPVRDKVARAMTFGAMMYGRSVYFLRDLGLQLKVIEDELAAFPNGRNDDFVDTGSIAADEILRRPRPSVS